MYSSLLQAQTSTLEPVEERVSGLPGGFADGVLDFTSERVLEGIRADIAK
jgi:hypothetical protein